MFWKRFRHLTENLCMECAVICPICQQFIDDIDFEFRRDQYFVDEYTIICYKCCRKLGIGINFFPSDEVCIECDLPFDMSRYYNSKDGYYCGYCAEKLGLINKNER